MCLAVSFAGLGFFAGVLVDRRAPRPVVEPDNLNDYEKVIITSYPPVAHAGLTALLSDELAFRDYSHNNQQIEALYRKAYLWGDSDTSGGISGSAFYFYSYPWRYFYSSIYSANHLYETIDVEAYTGEEALRAASLKAEAALIRAYCYLMLAILYAENYDEATADTALCVPLELEARSAAIRDYKRHTVREVYDQIEQDLLFGLEHLNDRFVDGRFRFFRVAAYALASRYYLYKAADFIYETDVEVPIASTPDTGPASHLRESIVYATRAISINNNIRPLSNVSSLIERISDFSRDYYSSSAPDVLLLSYAFSSNAVAGAGYYLNQLRQDVVDNSPGDVRASLFFFRSATEPDYHCMKFNIRYNASLMPIFRVEELYFNRAEAFARLGAFSSALEDLNKVTVLRFRDLSEYEAANVLDYDTQRKVLDVIAKEKRFEFPLEGHRWVDLKRMGGARLVHEYLGDLYVLEASDPRFVLPIPRRELDVTSMLPNPSNDRTRLVETDDDS